MTEEEIVAFVDKELGEMFERIADIIIEKIAKRFEKEINLNKSLEINSKED